MSRHLTFNNGRPVLNGEPTVLLAATWQAPDAPLVARREARALAAAGVDAVWLDDAVEAAVDAARRADLLCFCSGAPERDDDRLISPAALPAEVTPVHLAGVQDAWRRFFDGALLLVGPVDDLAPLVAYRALTDDAAGWQPVAEVPEPWRLRQGVGEGGAYTAEAGDLVLALDAWDSLPAIHWIDPATGRIVAIVQPDERDRHTLRFAQSDPVVLYLGPSRYDPADEADVVWEP